MALNPESGFLSHFHIYCRMTSFVALGSCPLSAQEVEAVKMHLEKLPNTVQIVIAPVYLDLCQGFEVPVICADALSWPRACQPKEAQAKIRRVALDFPGPCCFVAGVRGLNVLAESFRLRGLIVPGIWAARGSRVLPEVVFDSRPTEFGVHLS